MAADAAPESLYPAFVQDAEGRARWDKAMDVAVLITQAVRDSSEAAMFASSLYWDPSIPTSPAPEVQEGAYDAKHHLLRGRGGRWVDKPDVPKPVSLRSKRRAVSVGSKTLDDIQRLGLDEWPEPSDVTREVIGDAKDTTELHLAKRPATEKDSPVHAPYKVKRRILHDRIIGRALAEPIAELLGEDSAIVQKLAKGGRLSEEEKQQVRAAADADRGGDPPDVLFTAGGPASGKTTTLEENPDFKPSNAVEVDPDQLKEQLPEYAELRAARDHYAASAVHPESGDLAARLAHEAQDLRLNTVIDGTGDSDPGQFVKQLQRKHDSGYDVRVLYANTPTREAIQRAVARAEETGRYVPVPAVREQHTKVSRNFSEVEALPWLQALDVFDEGEHVGALGRRGFHEINPERMAEFRSKAKEPYA